VPAAQSAHPPVLVFAPVVALPCPSGHSEAVHVACLTASVYVPAAQSVHIAAFNAAYVPATQSTHPAASSTCLVDALPCPSGHFETEHVAEFAAAHVPAAQSAHPPVLVFAPVVALPCPSGHSEAVHVACLTASVYVPAAQSVHIAASAAEDVPAAQSAHPSVSVFAPVVALPCPAGHFEAVHVACLTASVYVPAAHAVHVGASAAEYVPAAQSAHPPVSVVASVVALPCPSGHFEALQIHEFSDH